VPDRHRQAASRSNGYEANSNDGGRNLQMGVVRSIAGRQAFMESGDLWRGYERRTLGSILRADADRMDRFRLATVKNCRRKGPFHSSACIDNCSGCRACPASFAADQDRSSAYDRGQCISGTVPCDEGSCPVSKAWFRRSADRGARADELRRP